MSDRAPRLWIWSNMPQIAAAVLLCGTVFGVLTYLFGGFRPQSQIDMDQQKAAIVRLESRQAVAETRLDALPRASDFAEWAAHLSRLDAVYEGQRDKVTANGYDIKDLQNKYGSLTTSAPRK